MSNELSVYNDFNVKLAEFITVLQGVCPSRHEQLQQAMALCGISVNISPKIPVIWFKKNVTEPLGDAINKKDITTFVENTSKVEKTNTNNKMDFSIADIISNEAANIKSEHMDMIWRYMKILVLSSNGCASDPVFEDMV